MTSSVLAVLHEAANAVRRTLRELDEWGPAGTRPGQYRSDLVADRSALEVLDAAGYGWLSEESGPRSLDRDVVVIVDPLDGSTNADRAIPWFATSLCALDRNGPLAALVVNQVTDRRYEALRGAGARVDGAVLTPSRQVAMDEAIVGISGYPSRHLGWGQYRALGAAALDLCAVAEGVFDAYIDCSVSAHGSWDVAAGALICTEAGAAVTETFGRPLFELDQDARCTPVAAGTSALLDEAVAARRAVRMADEPASP